MKIEKKVIAPLPYSYAVTFLNRNNHLYGVAASEMADSGKCILFPMNNPEEIETVWEGAGGTMSIAQIDNDGTFLAVQNFFKGFDAKTACIVKARPQKKGFWLVEHYLKLPYVHRFEVITIQNRPFILASTLCAKKEFRDDWSSPGCVYLGNLTENGEDCILKPLIVGITKNHGFCQTIHDGKRVVVVSGQEGLFEITIPDRADKEWTYEKLLSREISEAAYVDFDEDGIDELVTIEKFHGNRIVIYKKQVGGWQEVYSYPVNFGHVIWGGSILGQPGLLVAYRGDNAALICMRKKAEPGFYMEHILLDEHEGPTNLCVTGDEDKCRILCSCGKTEQIVLYTLSREEKGES